jgi:two-component system, NarL family, capsular synthesis sensor histidine kinase RcsC
MGRRKMPNYQKLRILLVDDNKIACQLLGHMLTALGHAVVCARNGRKALEIFVSTNGFSLIITDINMPLMDGWELALHLSEIKPEIPIIAVTGEQPGMVLDQLKDSPIIHAMFKPFDLPMLRETLGNLFETYPSQAADAN